MSTKRLKGLALRGGTLLGSLVIVVFVSLAWSGSTRQQQKTLQNLQTAYDDKANAHARYLAFADRAQHEEHYEVASLFRAAAYSQHIQFERFADLMRKMGAEHAPRIKSPEVKTTTENLKAAMEEWQVAERDTLYTGFIRDAEGEGVAEAARAFRYARISEAQLSKLFKVSLEELQTTGVESHPYYVCKMCGYTSEHSVTPCPGCSDPHATYVRVD